MRAAETIPEEEVFETTRTSVWCDGGGGALGHPRVFLSLEATSEVTCPYCSRKYVLANKNR